MRNGVHRHMDDLHVEVDMPHAIPMDEDLVVVDQEGHAKPKVLRAHSENALGKECPRSILKTNAT